MSRSTYDRRCQPLISISVLCVCIVQGVLCNRARTRTRIVDPAEPGSPNNIPKETTGHNLHPLSPTRSAWVVLTSVIFTVSKGKTVRVGMGVDCRKAAVSWERDRYRGYEKYFIATYLPLCSRCLTVDRHSPS